MSQPKLQSFADNLEICCNSQNVTSGRAFSRFKKKFWNLFQPNSPTLRICSRNVSQGCLPHCATHSLSELCALFRKVLQNCSDLPWAKKVRCFLCIPLGSWFSPENKKVFFLLNFRTSTINLYNLSILVTSSNRNLSSETKPTTLTSICNKTVLGAEICLFFSFAASVSL